MPPAGEGQRRLLVLAGRLRTDSGAYGKFTRCQRCRAGCREQSRVAPRAGFSFHSRFKAAQMPRIETRPTFFGRLIGLRAPARIVLTSTDVNRGQDFPSMRRARASHRFANFVFATEDVMDDRRRQILNTLAQMDKQFGKGSVLMLGSRAALPVEVIPTGSIGVDSVLGAGGFPRGRVIEIFGPESSGKTTLALHGNGRPSATASSCWTRRRRRL
jgi:hypothetical protein